MAITEDTARQLYSLSGNQCAFPDCDVLLVDSNTNAYVGERCHIKGRKKGAARHDPKQSTKERDGFENLVLFCRNHHKIIDDKKNEKQFTVAILQNMKRDHESQFDGSLNATESLIEQIQGIKRIGIRSFTRFAEDLDQKVDAMIDLVPHFDGRNIRENRLWHENVFPELEAFLREQTTEDRPYHLYMPAHTCIGFATGYCLDAKTGVNAVPVQATSGGKIIWEPDLEAAVEHPLWGVVDDVVESDAHDIALVLSITHDARQHAEEYIRAELPSVHRIIDCKILPSPSARAFRDGTHAFRAAEEAIQYVQTHRSANERRGIVHLFVAGPVSFLFFLGQLSRVIGRCTLYEHDFGGTDTYMPSMTFPH